MMTTTGGSSFAEATEPDPSGQPTSTLPTALLEPATDSRTTQRQQQKQHEEHETSVDTGSSLQSPSNGGSSNSVAVVGSSSSQYRNQLVDESVDNVQTVVWAKTADQEEITQQAPTDQDQSTQTLTSTRPPRVAATATKSMLARLAREEEASMSSLIASALVNGEKEPEQHLRKRPTTTATPAAKKSRVTASASSRRAPQYTLEIASSGHQTSRGKKRRQAPVFEPSPIITDLPPLPFTTTTPEGKNKHKTKAKHKTNYAEQIDDGGGRPCDYCNKVANLCALMHCTACRRVYHAQCLLHAFKEYVDRAKPIEDQIELLKLEAPGRRGTIFRCLSCKAAFMDFYETGGYLWDCSCPTCREPEKVVYYRQRKLVDMMNEMEMERQIRREKKGGKKPNVPVKTPASEPSRSNARSRRARSSSHEPNTLFHSASQERQQVQTNAEKMDDVANPDCLSKGATHLKEEDQAGSLDVDGGSKCTDQTENTAMQQLQKPEPQPSDQTSSLGCLSVSKNTELQQMKANPGQPPTPLVQANGIPQQTQEEQATLQRELVNELEQRDLTEDDIIASVRMREEANGHWLFPVMCSRTASLRESGIMKTGMFIWDPKKYGVIRCDCCEKVFSCGDFVHHTDSNLVKNPRSSDEDPTSFIFVQHRDGEQYTLLDKFRPAWRAYHSRQKAKRAIITTRTGHLMKQEAVFAAAPSSPTMTMELEKDANALPKAMTRLQELALFKRPKIWSEKAVVHSGSSDTSSMEFVARVVCLPSKYVLNMKDGSLADRVARSSMLDGNDVFPRKVGWLGFNRSLKTSRYVSCACCDKFFRFDEFVVHAGIPLSGGTKSRQFLYVVEREDVSALVPYNTFVNDLATASTSQTLQPLLNQLQLQSTSPRSG
ncbi:hypothetical protein PHYBOEH_002519 [Phytophthora boehmeriae]|uniref:Tify domain-containing protein n=1 Tax=Phytophthora boehmeriae TaxID=109152 RepID=A0A8T1WUD4_9STRA|nr:hypothetical protein PHYBOEH_002519 [Phytophthora boehmeriae]